MADVHSHYKETQILTASPGKLLIMLYDGAITAMEKALELIDDKGKFDKVNKSLIKAQEIIGELLASLDFEVGGDFAKNMQSLYAYMIRRLMEGNFQKTKEPIEEVLNFMKELRESWSVAIQKQGTSGSGGSENNGNFNISG
jgi:flagellar protein FliS